MYLVRVTGISRVISNLVITTLCPWSPSSLAFLGLDPPVVVAVSFLPVSYTHLTLPTIPLV